jgi:hypothetical protein
VTPIEKMGFEYGLRVCRIVYEGSFVANDPKMGSKIPQDGLAKAVLGIATECWSKQVRPSDLVSAMWHRLPAGDLLLPDKAIHLAPSAAQELAKGRCLGIERNLLQADARHFDAVLERHEGEVTESLLREFRGLGGSADLTYFMLSKGRYAIQAIEFLPAAIWVMQTRPLRKKLLVEHLGLAQGVS